VADVEQDAGLPVGAYLRQVRESRGLQLEEASRVTKIGKNYLVAIEEGQFEKLPNAAYIKGFLRLYAGFLSLSGDEIVQRYEQSVPSARPQVEVKSATERPSVEIMERAKLGGHGKWVIPVLLLGLVILATLFFTDGEEKRPRPTPTPKPAALPAPAPAPVPAAVQPQRSSALPAGGPALAPGQAPTLTAPAAAPVTPSLPHRDGVILRLRFNQDSWLSITIDDSISQRYDLKAGDIIEWKGARSFVLDIGDGAAAEGEFNGRQLKALGDPGKPAHLELKGEKAAGNPGAKER
jgi:cytoskeleton protein RodZ